MSGEGATLGARERGPRAVLSQTPADRHVCVPTEPNAAGLSLSWPQKLPFSTPWHLEKHPRVLQGSMWSLSPLEMPWSPVPMKRCGLCAHASRTCGMGANGSQASSREEQNSAFPTELTVWTGPRTVLVQGKSEMLGARCTQFGGLGAGRLLECDQQTSDTQKAGVCVCARVCKTERDRERELSNVKLPSGVT